MPPCCLRAVISVVNSCMHVRCHVLPMQQLPNACVCCTQLSPCLQDNYLPQSYYLMKQIMEVQDISSIEWHSCEAGCTAWEPTPKAEWHKHKDDKCLKCGGKRFKQVLGKDTPVRVRFSCLLSALCVVLLCSCCSACVPLFVCLVMYVV
jgi:hypothetical protein